MPGDGQHLLDVLIVCVLLLVYSFLLNGGPGYKFGNQLDRRDVFIDRGGRIASDYKSFDILQ